MSGKRNTVRDASRDPSLTEVLQLLRRSVQAEIRTRVPARIISYDATTQEASVSVESLTVIPDRDNPTDRNAETVLPPIRINGVLVGFPRLGPAYLTFPVLPGQTGSLVIFDRSIDTWRKSGQPSDPGFDHMHNLSDCIFEPDLWPKTSPITPATDQTATVVEGPLVKLGRLAVQALVKGTAFATLYNTHTHPTPAGPSGVPVVPMDVPPGTHLSVKVKTE